MFIRTGLALSILPLWVFLAACQNLAPAVVDPELLSSGIDRENFEESIRPQDDFFHHVNGGWLARTEIPADRPSYSTSAVLRDLSEAQQIEILTELENNRAVDTVAGQVGTLFATFMDENAIEALGVQPLAGELAEIDAVTTPTELAAMFGQFWKRGIQVPFVLDVQPDFQDSRYNLVDMWQGGLGLPNRDYYLEDTEKYQEIRDLFRTHIAEILSFVESGDTNERAVAVYALEARMAQFHWPLEDASDPTKIMNKLTRAELRELSSKLAWDALLNALDVGHVPHVVLDEPDFFANLAILMEEVPIAVWRDYLRYKLVKGYATVLSDEIYQNHFAFSAGVLAGLEQPASRINRGARTVNRHMGEGLGQAFVERYFDAAAKERMKVLVNNLRAAMEEKIGELDWMSEATKKEARTKLHSFTALIGYPDQWQDYSSLSIVAGDAVGNQRRAREFDHALEVDRLSRPVDKGEWAMSPQTVNAYYSALENKIVFPAAILRPPFFNMIADDAINYGAIGSVIGHEISHGFDDGGREFDGDGNMRKWWTEEDDAKFKQRTDALIAQFDAFEPLPGLHVNGKATLGENIGDLSGLSIAYRAYQHSLGGKPAPVIDGLTGEQRFFIGYANSAKGKMRDEFLRMIVLSDPHAPNVYRVNGVLPNFEPFYKAFGVQPGDGMYLPPEQRVSIW